MDSDRQFLIVVHQFFFGRIIGKIMKNESICIYGPDRQERVLKLISSSGFLPAAPCIPSPSVIKYAVQS